MSGEDDTFEIDIYGEEDEKQQEQQGQDDYGEDRIDFDNDDDYNYDGAGDAQQGHTNGSNDISQHDHQQSEPTQGTKRKAEDDDYGDQQHQQTPQTSHQQPTDPSATTALKIHDLHWWTTEEEVRAFCVTAGVEAQLRDIMFGEHKINGKSRGEAYLEFTSAAAANAVKKAIEVRAAPKEGETEGKRMNPFHVYFSPVGNPFKNRDSGAQGKKEFSSDRGRGGAYNSFNNRGGGFRGRGDFNRGGFNNRGGGFQGGMGQQGGGWNAGGMGMGGGYNNPMMGMGNMGMMGGMNMGYNNNMGRGGMMGGRGGFGGMGGMNMGMGGGGRGNMMGGGRGGWGGGFQQGGGMQGGGYGGQGYGMGMQGGPNKRMKPDG